MQNIERMNAEFLLNTHECDDGRRGRKFRKCRVQRNENERRDSMSVCVFHFKLSAPHFLEIGTTFDLIQGLL